MKCTVNGGTIVDMKEKTSYRISTEAKALLKSLADKLGINQTAVLEMLIRREARKEKVELQKAGKSD